MNKNQIISTLSRISATPLKKLGQNFLTNPVFINTIANTAQINPDDSILEIGPGLGALTQALLEKKPKKLIVIEKDPKFYAFLKKTLFKENSNPLHQILLADFLQIDFTVFTKKFFPDNCYKLIANLPYNIAKKILKKIYDSNTRPQTMTVLLQKEVGEKICAKNLKNSPLSLYFQMFGNIERTILVSKTNFYPIPKVDSIILLFKTNNFYPLSQKQRALLQLIKKSFHSPRKTLLNNLIMFGFHKEKIINILSNNNLSLTVRPEKLCLDDWKILQKQFF